MASGNKIVVTPDPKGVFLEGTISGTPKPGTVMEIVATALVNGRPTYRIYQPGTNGEQRPIIVCLADPFNGQLSTGAYATAEHGYFYVPQAGEELNMLVLDVAGTADDHTIGEVMMVKTSSGLLITTTGSPESEPFILLEAATDPTADALMLSFYTGY